MPKSYTSPVFPASSVFSDKQVVDILASKKGDIIARIPEKLDELFKLDGEIDRIIAASKDVTAEYMKAYDEEEGIGAELNKPIFLDVSHNDRIVQREAIQKQLISYFERMIKPVKKPVRTRLDDENARRVFEKSLCNAVQTYFGISIPSSNHKRDESISDDEKRQNTIVERMSPALLCVMARLQLVVDELICDALQSARHPGHNRQHTMKDVCRNEKYFAVWKPVFAEEHLWSADRKSGFSEQMQVLRTSAGKDPDSRLRRFLNAIEVVSFMQARCKILHAYMPSLQQRITDFENITTYSSWLIEHAATTLPHHVLSRLDAATAKFFLDVTPRITGTSTANWLFT